MAVNENRKGYKETKLGWIPVTWKYDELQKYCGIIQDGTHFSPKSKEGPFKYITSKNIRFGCLDFSDCAYISAEEHEEIYKKCPVQYGDILLTKDGANTGNAAINKLREPFSLLSSVALIRSDSKKALNSYIIQFILSPQGQYMIKDSMAGQAITRVTLKIIKSFKIPFPPLPEQKKIAEILATWDKAIELTQELIQAKTRRKKGLMQQLLTGKRRFGEFEDQKGYKKTKLGMIPKDWNVYNLKELGEFKNGINKDKSDFGLGYPFVNLMNVFGKTKVEKNDFGVVNTSEKELKEYDLKKGDILFVRSSVKPSGVGLTSLIYENLTNTTFSGFLIRFRVKQNAINFIYKQNCFHEEGFRKRLLRSSTISANTNINQQALKKLSIALPSLPEQKKIAAVLNACDKEIDLLNQKLEALKQQKKGLMQKLLTGQIRVTQMHHKCKLRT